MRALLTSAGLRNQTLVDALTNLLGQPYAESRVVVVLTASLAEAGDKGWLLDDLERVRRLGWAQLDLLDLHLAPGASVEQRLREADVVYVEGGNHYHLAQAIRRHDLTGLLGELLERKVYVGVSAGSMVLSRRLDETSAFAFGDLESLHALGYAEGRRFEPALPCFDWYLKPHLNSPDFPTRDDAWAERVAAEVSFPVCFLDDQSAVRVVGNAVEVVGEGRHRVLGGKMDL